MAAVLKTFKDGNGANFNKTIQDALGRQAAAESPSVALSTEDAALFDGLEAALGAPADAAWGGAGAGGLIALTKVLAIAALDTNPSPVRVRQPSDVITLQPPVDTAIYAAGDVLFATVQIPNATFDNDGRAVLMSVNVIDKAKQHPAFTLYFAKALVTSGAINAASTLTAADASNILGFESFLAADYKDLPNNAFACHKGINLLLEAGAGVQTIWCFAVLDAGTPTFPTAADLQLQIGLVQA